MEVRGISGNRTTGLHAGDLTMAAYYFASRRLGSGEIGAKRRRGTRWLVSILEKSGSGKYGLVAYAGTGELTPGSRKHSGYNTKYNLDAKHLILRQLDQKPIFTAHPYI